MPTIADELKEAGYHTALIGKWHLGLESPNLPNERGFDLFHGFLGDMMDSYTSHRREGVNYMRNNMQIIEPEGHATDLFSDRASEYLHERATSNNQPFFLYLAYNAPHFPIEPPAEWLEKVKQRAPQMDEKRAMNVAFVEHLDDRIGRVLAALNDTGLAENTVVVFSSDNGVRCLTPRTIARGAAVSRTITTAACACRSWCAGPRKSSPAVAAITQVYASISFPLSLNLPG